MMRHGERLSVPAAYVHVHLADGAQVSLAGNVGSVDELLGRALLAADLQDAVVLAHSLDQLFSFIDGERHRLLEVDVLAGLAGGDGDAGMPVVGSGDYHCVDVLPCQKVLVILIHRRSGFLDALALIVLGHPLGKAVALDVVDVTAGQHMHVVHLHEAAEQIHRLLSETDETHADLVAGSDSLALGRGFCKFDRRCH